MKFVIKREILLENLNNVSKAISTKNLIPILTGIKFEMKEDGLYLYASDTNISIRSFIPKDKFTTVDVLGEIVIGGRYIVEIIKKLPECDISIEVLDGFKMIVSTNSSQFNLNGINPDEFPNLDFDGTKSPIIFNTVAFKSMINQTSFATSLSESRPLLTGINFKIEDTFMEVIATDSYRLAKKTISLSEKNDKDVNIVIPGKNLMELSKILEDDKDNLEMHVFNNKVLFKYKNILLLSRLLSGTYPATSSIIPNEFKINVRCNYSDLFNMIDRASLLTSDHDKNTIKMDISDGYLIISSNSPEIGNASEKIVTDCTEEISISFSSKYMLEAIRSFNKEEIVLYMNTDSSPIVVKAEDDDRLTQLVLPIKTY